MENINLSGSELCFVVFPMALKYLPFSNLWAILFFLMMLLLGIDTMFAQFEYTSYELELTDYYKKSGLSREIFRLILFIIFSIVGLFYCLGSGIWNVVFVDNYMGVLMIFCSLVQPVFFMWYRDFSEVTTLIYQYTGEVMRPELIFVLKYISSSILALLLVASVPLAYLLFLDSR
jgi:hypothetical protein